MFIFSGMSHVSVLPLPSFSAMDFRMAPCSRPLPATWEVVTVTVTVTVTIFTMRTSPRRSMIPPRIPVARQHLFVWGEAKQPDTDCGTVENHGKIWWNSRNF